MWSCGFTGQNRGSCCGKGDVRVLLVSRLEAAVHRHCLLGGYDIKNPNFGNLTRRVADSVDSDDNSNLQHDLYPWTCVGVANKLC